jgi:hypothetical protein
MIKPTTENNLANMQHLSLEFSVAENAQAGGALVWLEVLDEELAVSAVRAGAFVPGSKGQQWLEVVLGFSTALLQVLRIPIFEVVRMQSCLQEPGSEQKWKAICERPDPSLVPPKVFESVI